MIWQEYPALALVVFAGAQIVCGIVGYMQGRKDERLKWLSALHDRGAVRTVTAKAVEDGETEIPDTLRSRR